MDMRFAKLVDGKIKYAPDALVVGDSLYIGATAEQYAEAGYHPVEDAEPECPVGFCAVPKGWEERDERETALVDKVIERRNAQLKAIAEKASKGGK